MKFISIFFIFLIAACSHRFLPDTSVQVVLKSVEYNGRGKAVLFFKDKNDSTRIVHYYRPHMRRPHFYIGHKYTIMYDSASCKPCDSTHWAKAIIKHNQ